ncbi:MAG: glycosyltransferase family 4 protein [Paludibacteraceae bacterium]|nr:glycosyltransferase family 4 protein [Paludibacteraceae bacterium]
MKIAYLLHTTSLTDGSTKAFLHLINQVKKTGIEPLVILPNKQALYQHLHAQQIPCVALRHGMRPATYPPYKTIADKILFLPRLLGRLAINALATIQSYMIVRRFHPDIIHTNTGVVSIGYHVARWLHIPHVWHLREYGAWEFHTYPYPSLCAQQKRFQKHNSYTIAITKALQQYYGLEDISSSQVIYDGVMPAAAAAYESNKEKYLLFAGAFSDVKGILPFIDAYAAYAKQCPVALPLWIAGAGPDNYTQKIKDKIGYYQLENQIRLLGMRSDMDDLYKKATALIVPSLFEGFGFITAEAMFNGCLVIGHDVAGTKEQFDNGKHLTGEEIALRYNTPEQLIQHLMQLTHATSTTYEPMIQRGQTTVMQLYTTEVHLQQILTLYNTIVSNK